jgi:hypothetical protein
MCLWKVERVRPKLTYQLDRMQCNLWAELSATAAVGLLARAPWSYSAFLAKALVTDTLARSPSSTFTILLTRAFLSTTTLQAR